MAVCPNGHDSASDDFCDTCGMRISGAPPLSGSAAGSSSASGAPSSAWPDPGPGPAPGMLIAGDEPEAGRPDGLPPAAGP